MNAESYYFQMCSFRAQLCFLRSTRVAIHGSTPLILIVLLCATVWIYHSPCVHFTLNRCVYYFQFGAIINSCYKQSCSHILNPQSSFLMNVDFLRHRLIMESLVQIFNSSLHKVKLFSNMYIFNSSVKSSTFGSIWIEFSFSDLMVVLGNPLCV